MLYIHLEAATRSCYVKKVFLKISQNSQENTCVGVSFLIKLKNLSLIFRSTQTQQQQVHYS